MRTLLYCLLLIAFVPARSGAQAYHPFPASNTVWAEYYKAHEDSNARIVYYGLLNRDTVINSKTYHRLYRSADTVFQESEYFGGLRDDTASRKVYLYGNAFPGGSGRDEFLLFDFSLNTGDTLKGTANNGRNNWFYNLKVTLADSVIFDGTWRKRIYLDFPVPSIWVEGVGNLVRGLTWYTGTYPNNGTWNELVCMKQHDAWVYHSTHGWRSNNYIFPPCEQLNTVNTPPQSVAGPASGNSDVRFSPNPLESTGFFELAQAGKYKLLEIFDMTGRRVLQLAPGLDTRVKIDRGSLSPGLYQYRLCPPVGQPATGRFRVN